MEGVTFSGSMGLDPGAEMDHLKRLGKQEQVKEVSDQFESIMLRQFLKDATKPVIKGYLDEDGPGSDFYQYFIVDTLATSISQGGGLGLSSVLQAQLTPAHAGTDTKAE